MNPDYSKNRSGTRIRIEHRILTTLLKEDWLARIEGVCNSHRSAVMHRTQSVKAEKRSEAIAVNLTKSREFLDAAFKQYHKKTYIISDPIWFPHQILNQRRQDSNLATELVAILSAVLSYGNVRQIKNSISALLVSLDWENPNWISKVKREPNAFEPELDNWKHRFQTGQDIVLLLRVISRSWLEFGSVGAHFKHHWKESDASIENGLIGLIKDWKSWANDGLFKGPKKLRPGFLFLLNSPEDQSCCKRWCMLLRWLGRSDEVDLGLWSDFLKPSQLVIPLDTHTAALSRALGLTKRNSTSWKMAIEVTAALKKIDAEDPIRFDFSLARVGIVEGCRKKFVARICNTCELKKGCTLIDTARLGQS